jgi:hypothetical protein
MQRRRVMLGFVAILLTVVVSCRPQPTPVVTPTHKPTRVPTKPAPTPAPVYLQISGWEEIVVDTLCLDVQQSYPDIEDKEPEPIAREIERILGGMGVQVLDEGAQCDAALTITMTGGALGAQYIGAGYCYNGVEIKGQMHLVVPEREPFTLPISATHPPPQSIGKCVEKPAGAPFYVAWGEPVVNGLRQMLGPQVLVQALASRWRDVQDTGSRGLIEMGTEAVPILVQALENEDPRMRVYAARTLYHIGGPEAAEAIPALIQALEDEDQGVRRVAAEALVKITDQDFGEDKSAWEEWWDEQQ